VTPGTDYVWPAFFPAGCPQQPHTCNPGTYIRLVSSRPAPPDDDFLPQIVNQNGVPKGEGKGSVCRGCALSVFNTREAAKDFLDNNPEFILRFFARMEVSEGDGVIQPYENRDPGHFLWWIPESADGRSYRRFFRGCIDDT
jgi:hypothetical protein